MGERDSKAQRKSQISGSIILDTIFKCNSKPPSAPSKRVFQAQSTSSFNSQLAKYFKNWAYLFNFILNRRQVQVYHQIKFCMFKFSLCFYWTNSSLLTSYLINLKVSLAITFLVFMSSLNLDLKLWSIWLDILEHKSAFLNPNYKYNF